MALTLIRKEHNGGLQNISFTTDIIIISEEGKEDREELICRVCTVDDEMKPVTEDSMYSVDENVLDFSEAEEIFHTKLRKVASEHDHLITSHSTDPEWNPEGYTKNLKDE